MVQQRGGVPGVDFHNLLSGLVSKLLDNEDLSERVADMLDFKSLLYLRDLSFKLRKEKEVEAPWLLDRKQMIVVKLLRWNVNKGNESSCDVGKFRTQHRVDLYSGGEKWNIANQARDFVYRMNVSVGEDERTGLYRQFDAQWFLDKLPKTGPCEGGHHTCCSSFAAVSQVVRRRVLLATVSM